MIAVTLQLQLHLNHFTFITLFESIHVYKNVSKTREKADELVQSVQGKANTYLFKFTNRITRKMCKICSNLTIKTLERFIDVFLVFLDFNLNIFLTFNIYHTFFSVSIVDLQQVIVSQRNTLKEHSSRILRSVYLPFLDITAEMKLRSLKKEGKF